MDWKAYYADGSTHPAPGWSEAPQDGLVIVQCRDLDPAQPYGRWWVWRHDYYTFRPEQGDQHPWGFDDLRQHLLLMGVDPPYPFPRPEDRAAMLREMGLAEQIKFGVMVPDHLLARLVVQVDRDPDFPRGTSPRRRLTDGAP